MTSCFSSQKIPHASTGRSVVGIAQGLDIEAVRGSETVRAAERDS